MRTILLLLIFVTSASGLKAQRFEGTLTWKITSEITDPDLKAQVAKMQAPASQAKIRAILERMNDPQYEAMVEADPQLKRQVEHMVKAIADSGGREAMIPNGLIVKFKEKRTLSVFQGGAAAGMELLHLPEKDKYQLFRIDRTAKTYTPLGYDMSAAAPENEKVKKTKETRKILGYTCTKYIVDILYGNDVMQQVFWATPELDDVYFRGMGHQRFVKGQPNIFYRKIDGVPLLMEMKHPKGTLTLEATQVKRETFSAEDFVIPTGFREVRGAKVFFE